MREISRKNSRRKQFAEFVLVILDFHLLHSDNRRLERKEKDEISKKEGKKEGKKEHKKKEKKQQNDTAVAPITAEVNPPKQP